MKPLLHIVTEYLEMQVQKIFAHAFLDAFHVSKPMNVFKWLQNVTQRLYDVILSPCSSVLQNVPTLENNN